MPYLTTSRPCNIGMESSKLIIPDKVFVTKSGYSPYSSPTSSFFGRGQEICWGFRTGTKEQRKQLTKSLTGDELKHLVYSDTGFEPDEFGGVTFTGHRSSDIINWPYDNGHNFRLFRSFNYLSGPSTVEWNQRNTGCASGTSYRGPIWLNPTPLINYNPVLSWANSGESTEYYQRANRTLVRLAPMAPSAFLARALGEILKDGLPSLPGLAIVRSQYRNGAGLRAGAAEDYLNYTFAFKPTLQDATKLGKCVSDATAVLKKYNADLNEAKYRLHRRSTLVLEKSTPLSQNIIVSLGIGRYPIYGWSNEGITYAQFLKKNPGSAASDWPKVEGTVTDVVTRRVWLECEFEMYLVDLLGFLEKSHHLSGFINHILGGELTTQNMYDLFPWTWLTNWFSDLSSIIGRADYFASHDVVLRYGYIMHEYSYSRLLSASKPYFFLNGRRLDLPVYGIEHISKSRWRATPYGFGLAIADFTAAKWAVLTALGYIRATGILNYRE